MFIKALSNHTTLTVPEEKDHKTHNNEEENSTSHSESWREYSLFQFQFRYRATKYFLTIKIHSHIRVTQANVVSSACYEHQCGRHVVQLLIAAHKLHAPPPPPPPLFLQG